MVPDINFDGSELKPCAAVNKRLNLLPDGEAELLRIALWHLANPTAEFPGAVVDPQLAEVNRP
ncbi:hypothetical protein AAGW05_16365 [Arthrobacter sp. LAPM80]|uniref:hypothetical protein n=1 Tax=Arthrobacter sp. LAPM80 TaxID=3141788 RepID=UPI00398B691D